MSKLTFPFLCMTHEETDILYTHPKTNPNVDSCQSIPDFSVLTKMISKKLNASPSTTTYFTHWASSIFCSAA